MVRVQNPKVSQNTPPAAEANICTPFLYYLTISPSLPGWPRPMLTMIMTTSTTFTIDEYHEDEGDDDPEMGACKELLSFKLRAT